MTATNTELSTRPETPRWLLGLIAFQLLYGLGAVALVVRLLSDGSDRGTLRYVLIGAGVCASGLALLSALWLARRSHRGRLTAFLLNYLLAVVSGFLALQAIGFFNGLDALGETFPRGLPFLALVAVGALLMAAARRLPTWERPLRLAGRITVLLGMIITLVRVGLLPGLVTFLTRLVQPPAIVWLAIAALAGFWALTLWRDSSDDVFNSTRTQTESMQGIFFVSPNVIGFLAFFAGPLLFSLVVTFTDWDGINQANWIGLDNYAQILAVQFKTISAGVASSTVLDPGYVELFRIGDLLIGARDVLFWTSLRNVVQFAVIAVPLSILPALIIAALLNSKIPFVKVFRAIYFLPSIAGVVGVALIWKQLFSATIGFVNYFILRFFDLVNLLPGVEIAAPQPEWLASPSTSMLAVIIVFSWSIIGFNTVLFLAGMQGIPAALYEAADLDGANAWAKFRRITVPMLAPTTVFVVATTTILALQLFNEPFILNIPNTPNGPSNSTLTPVIHLYRNAFEDFDQGYASSVAWILFVLIFGITLFYFRRQGDEGVLS